MKILQINAVYGTGSTGRIVAELDRALQEQGIESLVVTPKSNVPKNNICIIGSRLDRKIHGFWSRLSGKQGHFSKGATKKLIRYMEKQRPDVVHLHNLHGNYIHLPMLLRYLGAQDVPTVLTLHDCWFYTGKCCHYTVDGCSRWKSGCHSCPRLHKDNVSWFRDATPSLWAEKKALFDAIPRLAVAGVSDWITSEARQSFLSGAREITRIYNWIDLEVFLPRKIPEQMRKRLNLSGQKVVLGVASGWSGAKGLDGFIELSRRLGREFRVLLVGKMPKGQILPEEIRSISATDSAEELAGYYNLADVFITLSLEESFGKVSAEALACGTPVVCYDSTANRELVGPGCGYAVSPGKMDEIEKAVRAVCEAGKGAFSEPCRAFAAEHFDKAGQISEFLALYRRITE